MKNLINGGYQGKIYPINPRADEVLGYKCFKSVKDIPGPVDVAVFAIPAKFVAGALEEVGQKKIPGAVMIPSGFAETGEVELQNEMLAVARKHNVRVMGPNIYGFYYTPKNLCATFCTPYDVKGKVALSSQSGGVGMSIIGFSRSTKMGVSAIVGLGNKSDLDEDDLLALHARVRRARDKFTTSYRREASTKVAAYGGRPVYLRDVATVTDGPDEPAQYVWMRMEAWLFTKSPIGSSGSAIAFL